jgi:hypothetical protein
MKLKEFRVREFRSIWDSGPIKVDGQTTCFVGKNEAGKTTLLNALYRTNPIRKVDAVFEETFDYPKREVEDWCERLGRGLRHRALGHDATAQPLARVRVVLLVPSLVRGREAPGAERDPAPGRARSVASDATKDRFEAAFQHLNAQLK